MKLTEKERRVLAVLELNADELVQNVRALTHLQEHTIRYHLGSLVRRGIARKTVFINVYPLGYVDYAIYFSLSADSTETEIAFIQELVNSPQVSWIARLGGDFQYGFAVCAKTLWEVMAFLDTLSEKFPTIFFEKAVSVRVSLSLFARRYLSDGEPPTKAVSFGYNGSQIAIDDKDHQILSALATNGYHSHREIARSIPLPRSTFMHRFNRLQEHGVIARSIYLVDPSQYGMESFRLLVYVKGINPALRKTLYSFSEQHRNITYWIECFGSWDFELGVEVQHGKQVVAITQELYSRFGNDITKIQVMSVFDHPKISNFPFRDDNFTPLPQQIAV